MAAPFYSLLLCSALVIVIQVAGNATLFFGTLFMVAAPLTYLVRQRFLQGDKRDILLTARRAAGAITFTGVFLLLLWAFGSQTGEIRIMAHRDSEETLAFMTYLEGIRIVVEVVGRLMITSTLFSDFVLAMSVRNWKECKELQISEPQEREMVELEKLLPGSNKSMIIIIIM